MAVSRTFWSLALVLAVLAASFAEEECDSITEDDTELLLTYVIWRHGARTPIKYQVNLSHDPDTLESLTLPYGYGALTQKGKQQAFDIGTYLRARYGDFIASKYNSSEVYFRSTDVDRTKMTGLAAMAALYAPIDGCSEWNPYLAWEPVPYTTLPVTEDYMSSISGSCSRVRSYFSKAMVPANLSLDLSGDIFTENADLLKTVTENLGANYAANPFSTYFLYDTYQSAISLGMTVPTWLSDVWDDLELFVDEMSKRIFSVEEVVRLNTGVLLYNFLSDAQQIIESKEEISQRVKFYSAHDVNVAGVSASINVPSVYNHYASVIALELRKIIATDEIVVLPVLYSTSTSQEVEYLQVGGCSSLYCNFDEFTSLTSLNALNESVWIEECAISDAIPLPV